MFTTLYRPSIEHFQGYPVRDRIALGRNIRPRGFRQKIPRSANEQMESRGQVISDLETGYALTTSHLGHFQFFWIQLHQKTAMRIPTSLCNQLLLQESTLYNYYICTYSTIIPNASSKKFYGRQILVLFLRLVKSAPLVSEQQHSRHSEKKHITSSYVIQSLLLMINSL